MKAIAVTSLVMTGCLMGVFASPTQPQATAVPRVTYQAANQTVSPDQFRQHRTNPWFPLHPGTVATFRGRDGHEHYRERVTVTHHTKTIQGVRTTVVLDVLRRTDGTLAEKTQDWYATDDSGRVWYFGEATGTYDGRERLIDHDGSWQAGRRGAVAGLIMPAQPRPTQAYRQEFRRGVAEDQAWIVQRGARVTTPSRTYRGAVRSFEWARLEPGVVSVKFYVRGIGLVAERDLAGGHESFGLAALHH